MWNRKQRLGYVPGKDFVDTGDITGIKLGIITRVDEVNLKCDIKIVTGVGERKEVELTQGMYGPRSFWGGIPEVNSLVIVGYRRKHKNLTEAMILGYLPMGFRSGIRFDPVAVDDPGNVEPSDQAAFEALVGPPTRYKRLMLHPGDVGGMSASGSEFVLSKDVTITNRPGDFIELRDSDRTLITQAIHSVHNVCGVRHISGPARRSAFFLPTDLFEDPNNPTQIRNEDSDPVYYGIDELQSAGPGTVDGSGYKFANTNREPNEIFNDENEFPPVTFSNGRKTHYIPTSPAVSIEDADAGADAFVEDRLVLSHTSNLSQEVLEEIDGWDADQRVPYIERVLGTVVGNDLLSSQGQRQYARVLKPKLFPDFNTPGPGKWALTECSRAVTQPDLEVETQAGAFLFRIRKPRGTGLNEFAAAVSKQGKLYLNVPGSEFEDGASGVKNVSAEVNMAGALKAFFGASAPNAVSANVEMAGGLKMDIGKDAFGNALDITLRGGIKTTFQGTPNEQDVATSIEVRGVKASTISGAEVKFIEGAKKTQVSGLTQQKSDRHEIDAFSGMSVNCGELNQQVAGKSQFQYALAVIENIIAGGKVSTILAGGLVQNVAAGAMSYTVAAGATTFNNPAGAFNITVGTGALSMTTGSGAVTLSTGAGALAITAGGGAVTVTSGAALTLTAAATLALTAPLVTLGAPSAFGVLRGIPGPPGAPTLNPLTGTPMIGGAATVFCI